MPTKSVRGPFRPGPGGTPPYLAGRESEQSFFHELVGDLERGIPPQTQVVLYGPRGNGKTVLLHWLEDEVGSRSGVEVLQLSPAELHDVARFVELSLPMSWWNRLTPQELAIAGFSWKGRDAGPLPAIQDVLAVRSRKCPLVLLLDEAHTLDLEVGRALWTAGQIVGWKLPFLLVLAGTPNLRGHLNAMGVSFWSRAERLALGRLTLSATAEAFRRPFEEEGFPVEADALAMLVEESHGYPYFVQLLGRSVWRCATGESAPRAVSPSTVAAALPEFRQLRDNYYLDRYTELDNRKLLAVGRRVAEAFGDRSELADSAVAEAIAGGLDKASHKRVMAARDTLSDLGFIWGPGPTPDWEPGIPSLMDYIRERAPT